MEDEKEKGKKQHQYAEIEEGKTYKIKIYLKDGSEPINYEIDPRYLSSKDQNNIEFFSSLGEYFIQRFYKEGNMWTHLKGMIGSLFGGKPYTIKEKMDALELFISIFPKDNMSEVELPPTYQYMPKEDFDRVIGAMENGRLTKALDKYCKDNNPTGINNIKDAIEKIKSFRTPSNTSSRSPSSDSDF